jgi:hypothetical protein
MDIQDFFKKIPDFRRSQGKRYPLDAMLTIILIGVMNGYAKYREIANLAKRHEQTFVEAFGLKNGVPSHVTIREIILNTDFEQVLLQFNLWAQSCVILNDEPTDENIDTPSVIINIDGKGIRSSLQDYSSSYQDFVCFAHVYAAEQGVVIQTTSYQNKEESEIPFVQALIEKLTVNNALITLDALHTQKKQLMQSSRVTMTS